MRAKLKAAALRQVSEIRGLQRIASEGAAMRAAQVLRERAEAAEAAARRCKMSEERWLGALQHSTLAIDVAAQWAEALYDDERTFRGAQNDRDAADVMLVERRQDWKGAVMREEVAREAAKVSVRDLHRERDEAQLLVAADLYSARRLRR